MIRRRRLEALFRRASGARVSLCMAAAGFGKTVAVEHFLRGESRPVAWVKLTERCSGLFDFARELARQLSHALERPELNFSAVYDRVSVSATPEIDLVHWLRAQLPDLDVVIVIDNFEIVMANQSVVRYVDRLVRDLPALRWFILTRTAGSLPIPNWMADGLLDLPIESDAFAFSEGEIEELARKRGSALDQRELFAVELSMHGWALGIDMRLRYTQAFADFRYDRRNGPGAYRDLLDRCFALCTTAEQEFLTETAVMYELVSPALREMGWKDARKIVRSLAQRIPHLFDQTPSAFFYHDLARRYLIDRLCARSPEALLWSVERCGTALEHAGRADAALALYIEQGVPERMTSVLESSGFQLLDGGSADLVSLALNRMPPDGAETSGATLALRAACESRVGRHDVAEAQYTHALKQSGGSLHDDIAYRYACDLLRRQRPDSIAHFEVLAERAEQPEMRANVFSALAQAYFLQERVDDANASIQQAIAALDSTAKADVTARTLGRAAYVSLYSGDTDQAADYAARAIALGIPAAQYVVAIGALSVLYNIACERGSYEDALRHIKRLGELSAITGNLDFQLYALAGAYQLYAEAHDLTGIARSERALNSFDVHYDTSTTLEAVLPARAMQRTWTGDFDRAYTLLAPSASQQRGTEWKAQRHSELALYAASCGRFDEAQVHAGAACVLLDQLEAQTDIVSHVLLALALTLLNDPTHARTLFDRAQSLATAGRMQSLLGAALQLHRRCLGARNHWELLESLEALYRCHLGGFARTFERIPMPDAALSLRHAEAIAP